MANQDSNQPIKIKYLVDTYKHPYAGTERQLLYLINGLDKKKFSVSMALLRNSEYISTNDFPCDIDVLGIKKIFSVFSIINFIKFVYQLKKEKFDLVHIYFNDAAILAPFFLKLFNIKVIVSRRDMGFWYNVSNLKLLRLNRFFIDAVIANAHAVKDIVSRYENISGSKIHVIYNGFDFDKVLQGTQKLENEIFLKTKNETRLIGIVANIRPVKRMDDLIQAFAIVKNDFSTAELVVVGDGDADELSKLAENLDVEKSIRFMGKQTNTLHLIKQFDVAVLCSESEGLSNSIIEYMACGIPVVCTNVGGNNELVIDTETGYLVDMGDVVSLAEKIKLVLSDDELANKVSSRATKEIKNKCGINMMLQAHAGLYSLLCRGKHGENY